MVWPFPGSPWPMQGMVGTSLSIPFVLNDYIAYFTSQRSQARKGYQQLQQDWTFPKFVLKSHMTVCFCSIFPAGVCSTWLAVSSWVVVVVWKSIGHELTMHPLTSNKNNRLWAFQTCTTILGWCYLCWFKLHLTALLLFLANSPIQMISQLSKSVAAS